MKKQHGLQYIPKQSGYLAPTSNSLESLISRGLADAVQLNTPQPKLSEAERDYVLGLMYRDGHRGDGLHVRQDFTYAALKFTRAAELGHAGAQFDLGWMFLAGQGMARNYKRAAHWFRQAADQDDASAQFNLSALYADGLGVPRNLVEAYFWLKVSIASQSEHDQETYAEILAEFTKNLSPEQLREADKRIREWLATDT